jgi:hypothetical protein
LNDRVPAHDQSAVRNWLAHDMRRSRTILSSGSLLDGWLARGKWGERLDDERV